MKGAGELVARAWPADVTPRSLQRSLSAQNVRIAFVQRSRAQDGKGALKFADLALDAGDDVGTQSPLTRSKNSRSCGAMELVATPRKSPTPWRRA